MIEYIQSERAFYLSGQNYSYVMYVDALGNLQNLHYGAKIEKADIPYLIEEIGEPVTRELHDLNFFSRERMRCECGAYGRGDYRESTVILKRSDGGAISEFRYVRHILQDGAPNIKGLPHARSGGQTLAVTLCDACSDTELDLHYTVWDDSDVLARNIVVRNTGKETLTVKKAFSFCLDLPNRNYKILQLHGAWTRERTPEITDIGHGVVRLQSMRGASGFEVHPFAALLERDCTETQGACYGAQFVYSGSFALTAETNSYGNTRLQGGINDTQFSWELCAGESFTAPQALLCYSPQGLGALSRAYADFIREHIVNPAYAYKHRAIVISNWEATYFDFDNEKLFAIIDEAAHLDVDTFVLDDGWFGKRNDASSGLGDWFVNEQKLSGGLKAVVERCKQNGLRFGLWFEPEMVSPDSDLYRAHPDWAIHKKGIEPIVGRKQLVLDFTRKDVMDYIFEIMRKILSENDISYVKWDMNRFITECTSESLPPHRQGEFVHRYILGVYDLAERLTNEFPQIFFEGCASGGGRFDAGMLYYFPQLWTSDNTDGYERARIQWGTSLIYPLSAMSCHVSACPNHQTGRTTPLRTRGAIASLGATGYELNPALLSAEEKDLCRSQIAEYKNIEDLILCGDLYRLSSPFESDYFCEMVVSKDKNRAYVVGEQLRALPNSPVEYLRLHGLDESKTYRIAEYNKTASGKTLVSIGVALPKLKDYESFIWHIEENAETEEYR